MGESALALQTINKNRDIVLTVLRRGEKRELTYRLI